MPLGVPGERPRLQEWGPLTCLFTKLPNVGCQTANDDGYIMIRLVAINSRTDNGHWLTTIMNSNGYGYSIFEQQKWSINMNNGRIMSNNGWFGMVNSQLQQVDVQITTSLLCSAEGTLTQHWLARIVKSVQIWCLSFLLLFLLLLYIYIYIHMNFISNNLKHTHIEKYEYKHT